MKGLLILVILVLACVVEYVIAGYKYGHGGGYASHWQYDNGLHAPYKGYGYGGYGYGHGLYGAPGLLHGYGLYRR